MTLAICINCGKEKFGALPPCLECGYKLQTVEDVAKSMMLTDHFFKGTELHDIGRRIQEGESLQYDEEQLRGWVQLYESEPENLDKILHPEKYPPSILARLGCWLVLLLMFGTILAFVGMAIFRFFST
jgi:hypothetical protein